MILVETIICNETIYIFHVELHDKARNVSGNYTSDSAHAAVNILDTRPNGYLHQIQQPLH